MIANYPLTIGPVLFGDHNSPFEGPNGDGSGLGDLGSIQKAVVREFPGGIISAQLYGAFPKLITWSGTLFGGTAIDRSFELDKLCSSGQFTHFSWAQWSYDGFVKEYKPFVKAFNKIDYEIIFQPLANNSTVSGGNLPASSDPFSGVVSNAQNTLAQQAAAPASGATLPTTVQGGVTSLNQAVNNALQQTGGSVANIAPATLQTLQSQITSLQNILQPLITGSDPVAASGAADLNGTLSILQTAFTNSSTPVITTIQTVNPNLYALSAQYYGNPALYQTILDANPSLLNDPLPITNGPISLVIPAKPLLLASTISTVMQNASAAA